MVLIRYLPKRLSKKDRVAQLKMLAKSRKMYKQGKYYNQIRIICKSHFKMDGSAKHSKCKKV